MYISKVPNNLRKVYEESCSKSSEVFRAAPWEDRLFYALWLSQMYYFLCHATRLIHIAGAHFKIKDDVWHVRCIDHAVQEKFHERMALNDLIDLGYNIEEFGETAEVAPLYQSQYYLVQHNDPISIYGSILYLEGLSLFVGKEITDRVVKTHGADAASFLITHTNEDVGHIEQAFDVLKACPIERQIHICESLVIAQVANENMIRKCIEIWKSQQLSKQSNRTDQVFTAHL